MRLLMMKLGNVPTLSRHHACDEQDNDMVFMKRAINCSGRGLVEPGIVAAVLVLGLVITLSLELPVLLSVTMTALFGFLHGYAHGLEMTGVTAPGIDGWILGATIALHLIGTWISMPQPGFRFHCALNPEYQPPQQDRAEKHRYLFHSVEIKTLFFCGEQ